jgi:ribA/ribD-fused uncharacterized protein
VTDPVERGGVLLFWAGWPSQWFPSPFEVEGVRYLCAEQFMMAEKARLFGDGGTLAAILAARTPREHKALGREVAPFDARRWTDACREVVYRGTLAKFTQNADLRALLIATGELTLAEASPTDAIWGIGLAASDDRASHPTQWPGKNWLGEALMKVRADLRASTS